MKVFNLINKSGEVLATLKSFDDNMNYLDFKNICDDITEEYETNDLYTLRDSLLTKGFELVLGGGYYIAEKGKGCF